MISIFPNFIYSQIFIMGIHHTGTSIATNLTMRLGINGGEFDDFIHHATNPLKFWERKDVVELNKKRLFSGSACLFEDNSPTWAGFNFRQNCGNPIFEKDVMKIIKKIEHSDTPWVIKEPRMSLFASEWLKFVKNPMCLIITRNKLETIESLIRFSSRHNLYDWSQLYDTYYHKIEYDCLQQNASILKMNHADVIDKPSQFMTHVHNWISQKYNLPPFSVYKHSDILSALNKSKANDNTVTTPFEIKALTYPTTLPDLSFAFVTILTIENINYLKGTLVLGASIRNFYSNEDMICMVTSKVPIEWYDMLEKVGWIVKLVEYIPEYRWNFCNGFTEDQSQRWGSMMTKLRIWELPYDRAVYIDSDAILLQQIPVNMFLPHFSAEKGIHHSYFNAGVMIVSPSTVTLNRILEKAKTEAPNVIFGNSIDCTEQALLVDYFSDAQTFNVAHGNDQINEIKEDVFALHWITHMCRKPWMPESLHFNKECNDYSYRYWNKLWKRVSFHFEKNYKLDDQLVAIPKQIRKEEYESVSMTNKFFDIFDIFEYLFDEFNSMSNFLYRKNGRNLKQIYDEYESEPSYNFKKYYRKWKRTLTIPRIITLSLFFIIMFLILIVCITNLMSIVFKIKKIRKSGFQELGKESRKIENAEESSDEE